MGAFIIEPANNLIRNSDQEQTIQPKLMEVLVYLCEQSGKTVSADELVNACWPGQAISDNPIHKCIAQLRKCLGDNAKKPEFIATIPRKGYQVVAAVNSIDNLKSTFNKLKPEPPYVGPISYEVEQSHLFFGRENAICEATQRIFNHLNAEYQWLMVSGEAGVGKSSLVKAGIIPLLLASKSEQSAQYNQFCQFSFQTNTTLKHFTDFLAQYGLLDLEQGKLGGSHQRVIVFIDQLEQLWLGTTDEPQREIVFGYLNRLALIPGNLLITCIDNICLQVLSGRHHFKNTTCWFDLLPVSNSEMVDIITKPMAIAGLQYEYDDEKRESLDHWLLHEITAKYVSLTAAQLTLQKLFQHSTNGLIRFESYEKRCGIDQSIVDIADHNFQTLSSNEQMRFKQLLINLVTVDPISNCLEPSLPQPINRTEDIQLLQILALNGLIRVNTTSETPTIQLANKSYLTDWPTSSEWLREQLLLLYAKQDLQTATNRWTSQQRKAAYLFKHSQLITQAEQLQRTQYLYLSEEEKSFIQYSRADYKKYQRIKMAIGGFACIALVGLLSLSMSLRYTNTQLLDTRNNAENLISFILSDLKDKLEPLGQVELLNIVGSKTVEYFEHAGTENLTGKSLQQWLAALDVLGQVSLHKKELTAAYSYYQQREKAIDSALNNSSNNIALLEQAMLTSYWLGYIHYLDQHYDDTLPHWKHYLDVTKQLVLLEPDNQNWRLEQSYALNNLGSVLLKQLKFLDAEPFFYQSQKIKEKLLAESPNDMTIKSELADTLSWQASIHTSVGNFELANELFSTSFTLAKEIKEQEPNIRRWQINLYQSSFFLAESYYHLGRLVEAKTAMEFSQNTIMKLILQDNNNMRNKERLLKTYLFLAKMHRQENSLDQSLVYIDNALELVNEFKVKDKLTDKILLEEIRLLNEKAIALHDLNQTTVAMLTSEKAFEKFGMPKKFNKDQAVVFSELLLGKAYLLSFYDFQAFDIELEKGLAILLDNVSIQSENDTVEFPTIALISELLKIKGISNQHPEWGNLINKSDFNAPNFIDKTVLSNNTGVSL